MSLPRLFRFPSARSVTAEAATRADAGPPPTPISRRHALAGIAGLALGSSLAGSRAARAQETTDLRLEADTISFPTKRGGPMKGLIVRQRNAGRRPGVLLLPDQRGLTPSFRAIGKRLAMDGFCAFMPDIASLYGLPEGSDDARIAISKLTPPEIFQLFDGALDTLLKHQDCNGAVGALGYLWGGPYVFQLAMAKPPKIRAGVVYYTMPPSPDKARDIGVPMQFHYAEQDARTAPVVDAFEKQLIGFSKAYEQYVYEGVGASFANDTMPKSFNQAVTDLAWERTVYFLRRSLA